MTRKLRNSLNALTVAAVLCATGAFAAAAIPLAPAPADMATVRPAHPAPHKVVRLSRIRHSLAMPYFSFVPRG